MAADEGERMKFKITTHSGHDAPPDAVDQLLAHLGTQRSNGRFNKVGSEIRVTWQDAEVSGWDRPERMELEREELLQLLQATCDRVPELDADWYAIGPLE